MSQYRLPFYSPSLPGVRDGWERSLRSREKSGVPTLQKMEAELLIYGWGLLGVNVYLNCEFQQPTYMGVTDEFQ